MKELFMLIRERLSGDESLVLVTVVESSGSTPRGAGAHMLLGKGKDGVVKRLWGSIGGGLPENLAIKEAASLMSSRSALDDNLKNNDPKRQKGFVREEKQFYPVVSFKKYLLHANEAAELGLRCGGEISVFFRLLQANEPGLFELIEKMITCFSEEKASWLIMELCDGIPGNIADGTAGRKPAEDFSLGLIKEDGSSFFTGRNQEQLCLIPWLEKYLSIRWKLIPFMFEEEGRLWFCEPLVSGGIVCVFGGGHIAQELVPLLARLDFRCVVFDDREEFARSDLFPGADKVILGEFGQIGKYLKLTEKDFAVIVTRGHLWDLEAWAFALDSPAAYIGIIGSRTKHEFVKKQLLGRGFGGDVINASRVHAPIGIQIESETPAEIAVSIAGELVLCRAHLRKSIS